MASQMQTMKRMGHRLVSVPFALLLLALAVALVWGHTTTFGFVWDDEDFIQHNQSIRSLRCIPSMFTSLAPQANDAQYYKVFRPLRTTVYAFLVAFGGKPRPIAWIFHLNNVLWHTLAAGLMFALVRTMGRRLNEPPLHTSVAALLCALALAIHPVTSEVVCWSKGFDDIMACVFVLASTALFLASGPRRRNDLLALLCYALALYSKVSALPLFIFLGLCSVVMMRQSYRTAAVRIAPFFLMAILFLVHRHWVIGQTEQIDPISGSYGQTLLDMVPVVTMYLRLLMGIPPFFIDYSYMKGGYSPVALPVLVGVGVLVGWLGATVWAIRRENTRWIGLGLIWTGLFLLPVSNIVPMMQYMAERFLYLPLCGWILVLYGITKLAKTRRSIVVIGSLLLLLVWGVVARDRSMIWRDNIELFMYSSRTGPPTERIEENAIRATFKLPVMQHALRDREDRRVLLADGEEPDAAVDWPDVFRVLALVQEQYPENGLIALGYGIAHARTGNKDDASTALIRAARQSPKKAIIWANIALFQMDVGDLETSQQALTRAMELDPDLRTVNYAAERLARLQTDELRRDAVERK